MRADPPGVKPRGGVLPGGEKWQEGPDRGSVRRMRFLLSLLLLGAVLFAALFVPIEGQNGWHRAHRDGWPRAAAQTAAAAASESFRWAARLAEGVGDRARHLSDADGAQPGRKPAPPPRRRAMARAQAQRPASAPAAPAAKAPSSVAQAPLAPAQPHAAPAHDGIVPAPTKEDLDGDDRHALDKLIAAHGGR